MISSVVLWGTKKTLYFFVIATLVGSSFELLSLNTGIPFGHYIYTTELGPKIGQLPIFIPLLWASIGFYSMQAGGKYIMPFLMVTLDLAFDPRYSGHLWIWTSTTQYFGDPWTNFVGWLITSVFITLIFYLMSRNSDKLDLRAITFYYLFGIDNCISDIYSKLLDPAIISAIIFTSTFLLLIFIYRKGQSDSSKFMMENVATN